MKCIILGIVVLIRLSLMKVGEEMGLDEGESYIVKDKVMRLRKRNKKFIEFLDEIIKQPSLSNRQIELFSKIQNYTQFIYQHHLENNFDFKDLTTRINQMNLKLTRNINQKQRMTKSDFFLNQQQQNNEYQQQDNSGYEQQDDTRQEQQAQYKSKSISNLDDNIYYQNNNLELKNNQQQVQNMQQNIKYIVNQTQNIKQDQNDIKVQKIRDVKQQPNITEIQNLKERLKKELAKNISENQFQDKKLQKTKEIVENDKQYYEKLQNEVNQIKLEKRKQLNGLELKIESLMNYQKNDEKKRIEQDLQNRINDYKQQLDQELQKDMTTYQQMEEQRENTMIFRLIRQIFNNTGMMNDIQQQEIRNNNNSLLVQKILSDLIKSEQLKNEVVTEKINQLVKQVNSFKQVLEINKKLKQQVGQMKIEQSIILENLQRQSLMQNQQQNALKIMKQKINEYQSQLKNKNQKIMQLNQSLYERSSQFINESIVTEKSKYIINKLCLNIMKDFTKNKTKQLIEDYLQSLKFVKGVFLQQKTLNIDEVQTIQEYIQDSQDYYDEQMILGRINDQDIQALAKMLNNIIEFINLIPFDDQFKFFQKFLKKQFNDNLQPFLRSDENKERQKIVQKMDSNDDQIEVNEMIVDLDLDVDRTNKQMNKIQKDLISFLKEQQIELHY